MWLGGTGNVLQVVPPTALAFSPDGAFLAGVVDGVVRLWDPVAGSAAMVLEGHTSYVYLLDYSPDGTLLASSIYFGSETFVWDPLEGRRRASIDRHFNYMGFNPAGLLWVDGSLIDPLTDALLGSSPINGLNGLLKGIADGDQTPPRRMSPVNVTSQDGTWVAAGHYYDPAGIVVYEMDGTVYFQLDGGTYSGAAFSPDSSLLALASGAGTVEVWDLPSKQLVVELHGHASAVYCVDFHPDGQRLASGGNDGTIKLWDTTNWGHGARAARSHLVREGRDVQSGRLPACVRIRRLHRTHLGHGDARGAVAAGPFGPLTSRSQAPAGQGVVTAAWAGSGFPDASRERNAPVRLRPASPLRGLRRRSLSPSIHSQETCSMLHRLLRPSSQRLLAGMASTTSAQTRVLRRALRTPAVRASLLPLAVVAAVVLPGSASGQCAPSLLSNFSTFRCPRHRRLGQRGLRSG